MKDNQFGADQHYPEPARHAAELLRPRRRVRISNFDSPHRIILAPIVRVPGPERSGGGRRCSATGRHPAIVEFVERLAAERDDQRRRLGRQSRAASAAGSGPTSTGDPTHRRAATRIAWRRPIIPSAAWFNRGAFANPGAGQYGNAPRTNGDARYQFRKNIDLVVTKNVRRRAAATRREVRFEILNLTNTAKFAAGIDTNSIDLTSFSRITPQASFMRIWQLTFRYRFSSGAVKNAELAKHEENSQGFSCGLRGLCVPLGTDRKGIVSFCRGPGNRALFCRIAA